jgi:hypothetical protein
MHLENLAPLLKLWPLALVLLIGLAAWVWVERGRHRREMRQAVLRDRRYWAAEFAYRARLRAKEWLTGTRTPRLTYQGPPLAERRDPPRKQRP